VLRVWERSPRHRVVRRVVCGLAALIVMTAAGVGSANDDAGAERDTRKDAERRDTDARSDAPEADSAFDAGSAESPGEFDSRRGGGRDDGRPASLPESPGSLDGPNQPPSTGSKLGSMLLETLLMLAIVCLLAYVVLRWGVSRLVGGRGAGDDAIEILARQPVGSDSSILVVRIGPRILILADGASGMSRIAELDEEEAEAFETAASEEKSPESWIPAFLERQGERS